MARLMILIVAVTLSAAVAMAQTSAGSAAKGSTLYKSKCSSCHTMDANRIGPAHRGIFNRKAGLAKGYAYSAALKKSGIIWNEQNLDRWLQGPQKVVKGSKMFLVVPNAGDRAAIIAYLKSSEAK